jgi:lipopolysaccharide export system permease protein
MLSQLMVMFGFFALVLIMVYWINRAVVLFDQLIADGQSAGVFLEFTALTLPTVIKIVLPVAAFAASLYVTNRMSAESELTVLQATGLSPFRLALPVLVFGLIVAILMSVLIHGLAPAALTRFNARQAEIAQTATTRLLREGQFLTPAEGITVYIRDVSRAGELRDIFLSDSRADTETVTYTARRAYIVRSDNGPQLVMRDGMIQTLERDTGRLITTSFADLTYDIGSLIPAAAATRRSSRELSTRDLLFPTPDLTTETRKSKELLISEGHARFAEAGLALAASLLGFATLLVGGFSRFGVWKQVLAAIFIMILVKGIETIITGILRDQPGLWPLSYIPLVVGLFIVWFLLFFASRPGLFRRRPVPSDLTATAAP